MREQWAHAANPLRNRRPKLELFYIPHEESHMYKSVGTTLELVGIVSRIDVGPPPGEEVSLAPAEVAPVRLLICQLRLVVGREY